jgi:transcriptional regulator with XRE-family HTH domain
VAVALTRSSDGLANTVAANVRAELARRRMTARRLAVDIGVTPEWLSRRMRADVPLSVDDLDRIASALDLPPEALLSGRPLHSHQGAA